MLTELMTWIRQIIYVFVFLVLILQILPSGNYQKYVRFFAGLIFAAILLGPLISLICGTDVRDLIPDGPEEADVRIEETVDFDWLEKQRGDYYEENAKRVMEDIVE